MAREEQQPMSNERLAVIRAMITLTYVGDTQLNVIQELLAEVERLRAREAALLEVARQVAEGQPVSIDEDLWGIHLVSLRQSDVERFHQQARALLASEADEAK